MLYFLYGKDTYRSRQKLKEIIARYQETHKTGLSLKYFSGEDFSFSEVRDFLQQVAMFKEKKLLILSEVFTSQEFKASFVDEYEKLKLTQSIIIFYEAGEVDGRDRLFKFLKTKAKVQVFEPLRGEKLKNWIKQEFLKQEIKVSLEAVNRLAEAQREDLWFLANEINKLVNYKRGEGAVTLADVELLVNVDPETFIFKTIEALALKNKKQALLLIQQHLAQGESPLYLLSMISYQFKNLLIVKDLVEKNKPYYLVVKSSGLHPFVVKKTYAQGHKFTFSELKKIYQKIFQVDLAIKLGQIKPETALTLLVSDLV